MSAGPELQPSIYSPGPDLLPCHTTPRPPPPNLVHCAPSLDCPARLAAHLAPPSGVQHLPQSTPPSLPTLCLPSLFLPPENSSGEGNIVALLRNRNDTFYLYSAVVAAGLERTLFRESRYAVPCRPAAVPYWPATGLAVCVLVRPHVSGAFHGSPDRPPHLTPAPLPSSSLPALLQGAAATRCLPPTMPPSRSC